MRSELAYMNMNKCLHTINTVVSWVSADGCLNITRNFGSHERFPEIYMYICIEAVTLTPRNVEHGDYTGVGACLGHYSNVYSMQCMVVCQKLIFQNISS